MCDCNNPVSTVILLVLCAMFWSPPRELRYRGM